MNEGKSLLGMLLGALAVLLAALWWEGREGK